MSTEWEVITGDCLEVMRGMDAGSVDAVVTDPPAGISFMGKEWDGHKGGRAAWVEWMTAVMVECLRVLKPGGHALVWALPRTAHWTACAVEDAGFEVRDKVYHLFGSGFPKSLDIGKAIDKMAGAEREVIGERKQTQGPESITRRAKQVEQGYRPNGKEYGQLAQDTFPITAPATPAAVQWDGWHTALKPAAEEWILARKPIKGTVAANVLKYGTGGVNVGACRVGTEGGGTSCNNRDANGNCNGHPTANGSLGGGVMRHSANGASTGRYPAHLIHDGSEEVLAGFPVTTSGGGNKSRNGNTAHTAVYGTYNAPPPDVREIDTGSAARFFYCAKASRADRDEGNLHPTVKASALMRYLCRLITPPGGVILDPFAGSGSTGKGAVLEGFRFVGIEQDEEYADIARARIAKAAEQARQEALPL